MKYIFGVQFDHLPLLSAVSAPAPDAEPRLGDSIVPAVEFPGRRTWRGRGSVVFHSRVLLLDYVQMAAAPSAWALSS